MAKNHLFICDPLESLNLKLDSSLRFAFSLAAENHNCFICTPQDLFCHSGGAFALSSKLEFEGSPQSAKALNSSSMELSNFATIHMRKDPPFDIAYIETTWMMEKAPSSTLLLNHPSMLRSFNEKMGIMDYPDESISCVVSAKPNVLLDYIAELPNKIGVLKPLDMFGGRGVEKINIDDLGKAKTILNKATENGRRLQMIQPFLEEIYDGEIRVFTVGGKAISWCLKKPKTGEFLANTRMGATLHQFTPSAGLRSSIERVALDLAERGAPIVGMDIIGDKITEINITSPRLLDVDLENLDKFKGFSQWILEQCN